MPATGRRNQSRCVSENADDFLTNASPRSCTPAEIFTRAMKSRSRMALAAIVSSTSTMPASPPSFGGAAPGRPAAPARTRLPLLAEGEQLRPVAVDADLDRVRIVVPRHQVVAVPQ